MSVRTRSDKLISYIRWTKNTRSVHLLGSTIYHDGEIKKDIVENYSEMIKVSMCF